MRVSVVVKCLLALSVLTVVSVFAQTPAATDAQVERLSPQEQRGKEIYFGMETPAAPRITARSGNPPTEMPGTLEACVNCHGKDGKGNPEAAIIPASITWAALTKPYDSPHANGRTRPAYTERLLVRAVCMGIDPAGNELHAAMPRFQMSREDMTALIAYLKRLGGREHKTVTSDK
jgi:cytochrome c553